MKGIMPNGYDHRSYGPHDYPKPDGTSNCKFGCGCWMGPNRSDGPLGLDPFGQCPNNPLDGKPLRPKIDYEDAVNQRINTLTSRAAAAEKMLKEVDPTKITLIKRLEEAELKIPNYEGRFHRITYEAKIE